jgi:hypothetical protein
LFSSSLCDQPRTPYIGGEEHFGENDAVVQSLHQASVNALRWFDHAVAGESILDTLGRGISRVFFEVQVLIEYHP